MMAVVRGRSGQGNFVEWRESGERVGGLMREIGDVRALCVACAFLQWRLPNVSV